MMLPRMLWRTLWLMPPPLLSMALAISELLLSVSP
jgi:hypothetical protein